MSVIRQPSTDRLLADSRRSHLLSAADGLDALVRLKKNLARNGRTVLTELMGFDFQAPVWTHSPADDAHCARSGYRWYYHCHPREGRSAGEHGHFHLFADPSAGAPVTHLLAISVNELGLPIVLFAPNRWVTDERWQPASTVLWLLDRFKLAAPRGVYRVQQWLIAVVRAFLPQIRTLLANRDRRLAILALSRRQQFLEDRRIAVLSRCSIDLAEQARVLDMHLAR